MSRADEVFGTRRAATGERECLHQLLTAPEGIVRSISDLQQRVRMQADLAEVAATAGQYDHARQFLTAGEAAAMSVEDPGRRAAELAEVALPAVSI